MDTGRNELSAEMLEKIKECISNKEYSESGDILELVEGDAITDDRNRRLTDPSLFKLRGKQILNSYFDGPYPVMFPEKLITGCTKNFKPQKNIDMMEAVFNIIDADKPDRNGMIWQRDLLMRQLMCEPIYLIPPRHHKSWTWAKFLESRSYEIQHKPLIIPPSKEIDLYDEFYMDTDLAYTIFLTGEERHKLQLHSIIHWNVQLTPVLCIPKIPRQLRCRNYNMYAKYVVKIKPGNEYYLKDLKVGKPVISSDYMMDYITETFGPVDAELIRRVMKHNTELDDNVLSTPNLNDNKKTLERVIKKARKHK